MKRLYPEQCAFYRLCESDFISAYNSIDLMKKYSQQEIQHVFLRDMAVSYARPFSGSNGTENSKYVLKKIFIPRQYLDMHKEIMIMRNQIFAHTDLTYKKPKISDFGSKNTKWFPMSFRGCSYDKLFAEVDAISALIKDIQDNLRKEITRMESSV